MFSNLINKKERLAVVGLGYVGLPIALEFAKTMSVVGFDIKQDRIDLMKKNIDPSNELSSKDFDGTDILFTANIDDLKDVTCFIVAVPTPIDSYNLPDLSPLLGATKAVGSVLKKGDYVVYESTVYPGCTEEDCVPLLEETSGLKFVKDFKVGYSPERINPGDTEHTLTKITKVVSGCDKESSEEIAKLYKSIIKAGIFEASSIKVAEAAKIIENTQRDINIAFMNELSMIFNKMEINTFEVLEASGTKWNFLKFFPGLVGGHCIGVDPYYLTYKARDYGHHAQIINAGRSINDGMGAYVAKETIKLIVSESKLIKGAKVLIMGATFKENVSDIRNSKVIDVYNELASFSIDIDVIDPYASSDEIEEEYGFKLKDKPNNKYDAIIMAVNHDEYMNLDEKYFQSLSNGKGVFIDVKGIFRGKINKMTYWSM